MLSTISSGYKLLLLLILITIAGESQASKTILILGDSLSAGHGIKQGENWTDLLQQRFNDKKIDAQLINASISGDTSANGLNRLPGVLKQYQPDWLIIELGGNDGLRGLPIRHIQNNLESLIQTGLNFGTKVLLMTIRIPPNYGKKYTRAFSRIYPELAQKHSLTLLPFILNDLALNPEMMQTDGIHPNGEAQAEIMEELWESLKPLFE